MKLYPRNVFVHLGGFYQLMSFVGSIGKVMEGSGLRSALETIYSPVTVGHMFTGMAYSRAVRGHILCASAVQSLILEEFWSTLGAVDQLALQKYYESDDPSTFVNEDFAIKLTTWMETKYKELSKSSRTSAFWLKYVKYVYLVQEFILAERERVHDWNLYVLVTKPTLNLFAATEHNNYAKSCRLYLQSILDLETNYPKACDQFMEVQHTVRRTEKKWTGIWTDLSIEQTLIKSLKGRAGVLGRGITENVMHVWTITMHQCAATTEAMNKVILTPTPSNQHKKAYSGRVKWDYEDFEKIQVYIFS